MNSSSFVDILNRVKTLLTTDADLAAFCQGKWQKSLTAEIRYRAKREIAFSELPIVLVTRPSVTDRKPVRHGREGVHTLRLYAGFTNNDPVAGAIELIEFEEAIEDALTVTNPFSDIALDVSVGDSINDEGASPPAHFLVMHVMCLYQRKR